MTSWALLIENGTVIDGSGCPPFAADVAVEGDRLVAVEPGLAGAGNPRQAHRVIDASGLMVAPGFIDVHSHSDLFYDHCPSAESKVRQGVTTEVVGMCSFSPAPVAPGRADLVRAWMGGIGSRLTLAWETFGQYLDHLRGLGLGVNVAHFVGQGALRLAAVGADDRPPTADETRAMTDLLAEALGAGAFGFSTGLVYPPSLYASTEELIALARTMRGRGGRYFSHIRGEAGTLEAAVQEAIRIGEESGVTVQIAHIKAAGRENWSKMERALELIDEGRARGVDVTADVYPYAAASTKLDALLPDWMHDGGVARLLERLGDAATRRRVIDECTTPDERWRTASGTVGWDEVVLATCARRELAGKTLAAIAAEDGRVPAEVMLDVVRAERAGATMILFTQSEENVMKALAHPHVMVGSDALGLSSQSRPQPGKPHPRMYGTFPRVLGRFCRERRLVAWETAVHKMTGMPAAKLGFRDRGLVRRGYAADLVLFDPAIVTDTATYEEPHQYPRGIPYVIVNGALVVDGDEMRAIAAGKVLAPS